MVDLQALIQSELEQNPMLEEVGHSSAGPAAIGTKNIACKLVLPDLILRQDGGEYDVTVNHRSIPQLRVC
jgi:DNA-directed RNA polymerase specialized sigma54-like protein